MIVDQPSNGLQTQFLQSLRESGTPVAVYLVNGIRLQGKIAFFDNYVVAVRHTMTQLVYKHAISTIAPATSEESNAERGKPAETKPSVTIRTKRSWSANSAGQ
jgi:host factor-I protein